ncbi:MAG: bifunctional nuclease family protein [Fimbriimonadia bacterium]|nr:bifunctional nuclease family protein [Fimbriimonadia bacterium]
MYDEEQMPEDEDREEQPSDWEDDQEPDYGFSEDDLRIPTEQELLGLMGSSPSDPDSESEMDEHKRFKPTREVEVKVMGVYEHSEPNQPTHTFVLLRDNRGRRVPILIGRFEALSISISINGESTERPLTHDLMYQILERLEAKVERVVIDDLWHETFYAKIFMSRPEADRELEIDARPSDAIALALRFRAPIYMSDNVIETVIRSSEDEGDNLT